MTREEVFGKVAEILKEYLGCPDSAITDEANMVDDLTADSLDEVEIVMAVEEEFSLEFIEDSEWEKVKTVGQMVDVVFERVK